MHDDINESLKETNNQFLAIGAPIFSTFVCLPAYSFCFLFFVVASRLVSSIGTISDLRKRK